VRYSRSVSLGIVAVFAVLLLGRGYWVAIEKPHEVNMVLHAGCKLFQNAANPLPSDDAYFTLLNFTRAAWLNGNYQDLALASATLATETAGTNAREQARTVLIDFCSKEK
jgi:hypothetical protein